METKHLDRVVIRFVGDSGDGMQLTGTEFAKAAAEAGNDISTFPDFPAEIRAPAGSLFGVSGFQLHFSSSEIHTPGDAPDVLVAMNPAGLKTNLRDLVEFGTLIVNTGAASMPLPVMNRTRRRLRAGSSPSVSAAIHGITVREAPVSNAIRREVHRFP